MSTCFYFFSGREWPGISVGAMRFYMWITVAIIMIKWWGFGLCQNPQVVWRSLHAPFRAFIKRLSCFPVLKTVFFLNSRHFCKSDWVLLFLSILICLTCCARAHSLSRHCGWARTCCSARFDLAMTITLSMGFKSLKSSIGGGPSTS